MDSDRSLKPFGGQTTTAEIKIETCSNIEKSILASFFEWGESEFRKDNGKIVN